ncbi:hypothetical protein [Bacterioplanoides sp.]|uniref:hypothetical protein n=1 Tax=Bacterioplanoides sp. TaxID=2066072 RepID=UPI003B5A5B8C
MENEIDNEGAFGSLLLTLIPEIIAGLIAIAGLFVIFWASIEIYKLKGFSWRKVLPICLVGSIVVELALAIAETYLDWEVFVYIQGVGVILSSTLFLIAALAFIRFVNYAKST